MKYLIYCILQTPAGFTGRAAESLPSKPEALLGVGCQPVYWVSQNGLGAAVSKVSSSDHEETFSLTTPDIPVLLAYAKVIESLHNDPAIGGVIPLRYGAFLEEESQILRILEKHSSHYEALLQEMRGCVEMGIRILIADCGLRIAGCSSAHPDSSIKTPPSSNPGLAYLNGRRALFAKEERFAEDNNALIERCREAFAGLFVKCQSECPSFRLSQSSSRNQLISLYFLVPRRSVGTFGEVFRQICSRESARLLLSGPWPPFNFVGPARDPILGGRNRV